MYGRVLSILLLSLVLLVMPLASIAWAAGGADEVLDAGAPESRDIEDSIWYQGFLADVDTRDPINGTIEIVVEMYDDPSAGTSVWGTETHNGVTVTEGWFHIELGSSVPLPSFDDPPYYLELTVAGELMDTRLKLASVPMAYNAADLVFPFHGIANTPSTTGFFVEQNGTGSGIGAACTGGGVSTAVYGRSYGSGAAIRGYGHESGTAIKGEALGTGLAGHFEGGVDVDGDLETDGFQLTTSPSTGHVLTSDASGVATWQAPGELTLPYHRTYSGVSDAFKIIKSGADAGEAGEFRVENPAGSGEAVYAYNVGTGDAIRGYHSGTGRAGNFDISNVSSSSPVLDARTSGTGPAYYGETAGLRALEVYSSYQDHNTHVVHAEFTGTSPVMATAIYGRSVPAGGWGFGGRFEGGLVGVLGEATEGVASSYSYGVVGVAETDSYNRGVFGYANGGTINTAIYGSRGGSSSGFAGYFWGDIRVTGDTHAARGGSTIDHPLDPTNKNLCHSFVESPDMMNVYNGNVVLDASGEAWVELPEWFEAVNRDFRYQLTCIGGFAPVYVSDKVSGNRFRIAGGEPGVEISWQVTGIRQDNYAEANPLQVEQAKTERERGRYLHPEAYGLPRTMSVDYDEREERRLQLALESASTRPSTPATEQAGPDVD